jgi:hypothetical protein
MSLDGGSLLASLFVSSVGFVLFEYGRRMKRPPQIGVGLLLLLYPYFVASVWLMLGIGLLLIIALWVMLARGY